jgi:hypothetical protein
MRIEYLAAIAIVAAGTGLAIVGSLPTEKQSTPPAAQLATLLAQSVDPFLLRSGGLTAGATQNALAALPKSWGASRPFGRAIGSPNLRPKLACDDG